MIKKILIAFLLLIIIGLVAVYFSINSIVGGAVTKGFNRFGPEVTGTKTFIESTGVNVFDGDIGINGLFIGNPDGFEKPSAVECGEIYVDIEPSSLFSDTIVVNEIRIVKPLFTYDQNLATNNLTKLQKQIDENMKKFKKAGDKPSDQPAEAPAEEQPSKTLILHKLVVQEAKVDLSLNLAVMKTGREIALPEINKDFGGQGVTPAEAADYVLSVVLEKVVEQAAVLVREITNDPNAVLESVTGGEGAQALENAGDAVDKAGKAIKGLFD
ncbi:hypothetical protein [Cerasicoccus frondis]|uniref:hypothetical protein n=1 Tax=Cerasicoccus frondis TaxID=490090 RepID=UPI002852607E|nr:hypothetical protein [Cerasicoccus frondis]